MSDIEIPISYVWRVTPQIYMHTQSSVEISWYSILHIFYYLKVAVTGLMKTLLTASKERCRGGTKPELWWQGLSGDLLNLPTCYLHL